MEMVKYGIISMEEARNHDDKNVILRASERSRSSKPNLSEPFTVEAGDQFLLCSDGLCDMLDDEEIHAIWAIGKDVHAACESLSKQAKEAADTTTSRSASFASRRKAKWNRAETVRITREIEIGEGLAADLPG
jgi:serine/threonine protein phosphatase PrpC